MRTDEARMLHLQAHLDHLDGKGPLPSPVQRGRKRGTFNHEFLLRVGMYADAQPGSLSDLLDWLRGQVKEGHCTRGDAIETNSASHCQLNEAAAGVGLLYSVRSGDEVLAERFRDWWWSEEALCEEMAIPGREVQTFDNQAAKKGEREPDLWGGGWRALQDGHLVGGNACRDLCWRLVFGHPVPKRGQKLWGERYYLAARALTMLPEAELKALRPAPGFIPPLRYPFHSRRTEHGFVTWWDVPEGNPDVARSGGLGPGGLWVSTDKMVDEPQGVGVDWPAVAA